VSRAVIPSAVRTPDGRYGGALGARLVMSLLHKLGRRGGRFSLATLCVGVGRGQAALFAR
jgi:acetyl-CoA acetyltransferase